MPWYVNNTLLVLLFAAQHSIGTIEGAKDLVMRLTGGRRFLWNFVYSLTTIAVIAVMVKYWKSTDDLVWSASASVTTALLVLQGVSLFVFFFLFRYTQPFGEWLGTPQLMRMLRGDPEPTKQGYKIKKMGIKRYVRFPHHTVLIVMFWALPVMSTDLLLLAIEATVYLWLGSAHQDMRGKSYFGAQWLEYRRTSRMLFPAVEDVWTDVQDWGAASDRHDAHNGAPSLEAANHSESH